MRNGLKKYCFLFLLLVSAKLNGQVVINFVPSVYGQSTDGLAYAKIVNTSGNDLNVSIKIRVRELRSGPVVTLELPAFVIKPGVNDINRLAFSRSRIFFGSNAAARMLNQTQRFAEGEYEYCYELTAVKLKSNEPAGFYENCFTHLLQPSTPLLLIDPADGDKTCNKRPTFTWQPPMPLQRETRFRMMLVPIKEGQTSIEAISNNLPVINQVNLSSNMLLFPSHAPDLVKDQRYAWQVIAYSGQTIITRSEIWILKIECDENKEIIEKDSYREVKAENDGSFYVAKQFLRFSFNNPYRETELVYSIKNISEPGNELKKRPPLKMQTGLNKYDLDLSEYRFFKKGQQYVLTIQGGDGRQYSLRFVYAE